MKILELTNYSAGGCGVGARVKREAQLLAERGHDVTIFSSNLEKGTDKLCAPQEKIKDVTIRRFPARKLGGESFMKWSFAKEALALRPNVIIAHAYRHQHTTQALSIGRVLAIPVFLVTHAPFDRGDTRGYRGRVAVYGYDLLFGRRTLRRFAKIISITRWEKPYLLKLGVPPSHISYLPNGVSNTFFRPSKIREKKNTILFTGRIAPIKNLEVLLRALGKIAAYTCILRGPAEPAYEHALKTIIAQNKLASRVSLINKSYGESEQIRLLDQAAYFILPSRSEGMPQVLIEALARGKIVIASDNKGNADLIRSGKNGFLFKNGDSGDLVRVLNELTSLSEVKKKQIQKEARKTAAQFKWSLIIAELEKLITSAHVGTR